MKRLALLALLTAVTASLAPSVCRGQSAYGYSKVTLKDQTRRAPPPGLAGSAASAAISDDDAGVGDVSPSDAPVGPAAGAAAMQYPGYAPAGYAAAPPGVQVAYPGYAPTPENMMYGGSPYPQMMMPGSGGGPGEYGQGGSCESCGEAGCRGGCRPHHWIFGYDATADWISSGNRHAYAVVEGLKFFPKGANAPALLTSSPAGTAQDQAGVLGGPATEVLIGGSEFDDKGLYGGRAALGFWTMGAEYIGFEFNYMGFDNGGTSFGATSTFEPDNGGQILALPFVDATTGQENALVLAFPNFQTNGGAIDTGGVPIDLNGSFALDSDLEIHSAGALMKSVLWVLPDAGWRMYFLGGYRFFWLSDDLDMTSTIEPVGAQFAAGSRLEVFDSFDTENQFHGGDLGLQTELASGPWSLGIITKVALGNVRQKLSINGETRAIGTGTPAISAGGLFAQPTNIGETTDDRFAVLPEASLSLGYQVTPCMKLTAGYNFLYINHVARAAEQIDRTINTTQFDNGTLVGDARPARNLVDNEFWMHGVSAGVEVKW